VAVCDAWDARREQAETMAGDAVAKFADYCAMLDRPDIDAVVVAAFEHLHGPMLADACRAGKDVYFEKPIVSLPGHGAEAVQAAAETGRVVQVGMQQRSMPHFLAAKREFLDTGVLGCVHMVRAIWNATPGYLGRVPPGTQNKPAWIGTPAWLPHQGWSAERFFNRFAYSQFGSGGQIGRRAGSHGGCRPLVPGYIEPSGRRRIRGRL
jgi:predicted dehydrogenase